MKLIIRPLTPDLWPALEDLFGTLSMPESSSVSRGTAAATSGRRAASWPELFRARRPAYSLDRDSA